LFTKLSVVSNEITHCASKGLDAGLCRSSKNDRLEGLLHNGRTSVFGRRTFPVCPTLDLAANLLTDDHLCV